MTFTFSPGFAKRLKVAVGAVAESASEYVEARLWPIVKRDIKRLIDELADGEEESR